MGRVGRQPSQIGGDKYVHNGHGRRVFIAPERSDPCRREPAANAECARHPDQNRSLVRRIAVVNEADQRRQGWIVLRRGESGQPVPELNDSLRRSPGMNVVGGKLADGSLLLHIGEAQFATCHRLREIVKGRLLSAWPLEERLSRQHRSIQPAAANSIL